MSTTLDVNLSNNWSVVAVSDEVPPGQIIQAFLHGQELALWRNSEGMIQAWANRCPHRGTRFTMGRIVDDQLACGYHGWRFAAGGQCTYIPAHPKLAPPKTVCAKTYRTVECYGMVWACLGLPETEVPTVPALANSARHALFCRSFVTQQSADTVVAQLQHASEHRYQVIGPNALIGADDGKAMPILLVQPMADNKSILHLWVSCENAAGDDVGIRAHHSALFKRQRRQLEAHA
ncbi:Rieske 2Fe-2S domain-containing protein [Undibacterium arcticum]|uniref:Rieske 2Fe-2S domain-containing protein n=1 Tax=Undibacterium arcticum TaxID=1762892 RepID=A0ABV7F0C9_9BURK